mmetsp:Transcript_12388/g.15982  ORF Transcript_12388/g.15982 Transcript_12388/m.15982 type:complete len:81 (+) Transcript_12388:648-890(+)
MLLGKSILHTHKKDSKRIWKQYSQLKDRQTINDGEGQAWQESHLMTQRGRHNFRNVFRRMENLAKTGRMLEGLFEHDGRP